MLLKPEVSLRLQLQWKYPAESRQLHHYFWITTTVLFKSFQRDWIICFRSYRYRPYQKSSLVLMALVLTGTKTLCICCTWGAWRCVHKLYVDHDSPHWFCPFSRYISTDGNVGYNIYTVLLLWLYNTDTTTTFFEKQWSTISFWASEALLVLLTLLRCVFYHNTVNHTWRVFLYLLWIINNTAW